ncbi:MULTISPECIES: hypothetical protein [Amycolatopsis]|uniref:hypothetical protein n=1 Tax=Amycolatopsis TaxID=1813 RepID=UPI000B8A70CC|nr:MULTISPECIES: hypothetical protein [Amycolatopsis]OXM75084.1 hypothetical protein CF166_00305 [Amycolatopsis sp. KNN50.9b]
MPSRVDGPALGDIRLLLDLGPWANHTDEGVATPARQSDPPVPVGPRIGGGPAAWRITVRG